MSTTTDIGMGLFRKIEDIWRAGKSESLIDYTRPTRVSPLCLVDSDVVFDDIMPSVMQTSLSLFAGYYLQAWSISMNVGQIDVMRHLDKLNPNRNPIDSASNTLGYFIATEALEDSYNVGRAYTPSWQSHAENYRYGLPTAQMKYGMEALEEVITGATDENGDIVGVSATNGRDVNKELKELSNLAYGKLLSVEISDGNHKATVNVSVQLATSLIASDRLVHILSAGQTDEKDTKERWYGFTEGRLTAIKDMIFCDDLISEHRRRLMKDTDGLYSSMLERQSKNRWAAALSGNPSVAQVSNIVVISTKTAALLERSINGKLKDVKTREKLMKDTAVMILVIVDKEWGRATFYYKGIPDGNNVSQREMDSANKGSGPNVSDILKAYQLGNSPSL